ncbi:hypothetical protein ASC76_19045 [Rhizobacter sp. Root404]|nr:hypothetical protein ASC76_19045 [Rhizobacter sp. Root404]
MAKAEEAGRAGAMPPEVAMTKRLVQPVVIALEDWVKDVESGHARQFATHILMIKALGIYSCAYLALTIMMNDVTRLQTSTMCHKLANALRLEMEARAIKAKFESTIDEDGKSKAGLWGWLAQEKLRQMGNAPPSAKKRFLADWHLKAGLTEEFQEKQLGVARLLIDLVVDSTEMFERRDENEMVQVSKNGEITYKPLVRSYLDYTDELEQMLKEGHETMARLRPMYPAMVVPPTPWTDPYTGGYLTPHLKLELIKRPHKTAYIRQMAEREEFGSVLAAVNGLQNTAWRINTRVAEVATLFFKDGVRIGTFPDLRDKPAPTMPQSLHDEKAAARANGVKVADWKKGSDAYKAWCKKAIPVYEHNDSLERKNNIKKTADTLVEARNLAEEGIVWFPWNLDNRGRMYNASNSLSDQGDDLNKGILEFAQGEPVDNADAEEDLAVQVATAWSNDGVEKGTFEERLAWTYENSDKILAVDADPVGTVDWWSSADWDKTEKIGNTAWTFLAACFEWAAFLRAKTEGRTHVSHFVYRVDGSCNGLQHYGAALRCRTTGAAVNLVPGERPADVYREVAAKTQLLVTKDLLSTDEFTARAARTFNDNVGRSFVKRPVMTTPYAVTSRGIDSQIREDVEKLLPELKKKAKELMKFVVYARTHIQAALADAVQGARLGMDFLQLVARFAADEQVPVKWSIEGFTVLQAYQRTELKQVRTFLHGKTKVLKLKKEKTTSLEIDCDNDEQLAQVEQLAEMLLLQAKADGKKNYGLRKSQQDAMKALKLEGKHSTRETISIQRPTGKLDVRRQAAGIGPNFIHAADAAHARNTIVSLLKHGVTAFSFVHDSYGVPLRHARLLDRVLREEFVKLHKKPLLQMFFDEVKEVMTDEQLAGLDAALKAHPTLGKFNGGVPIIGDLDLDDVMNSKYFFAP